MEKLSRVKKYEDLRKSIEMDNTINAQNNNPELQNSEALLKNFDSSVHRTNTIDSAHTSAKRVKVEELHDSTQQEATDTFTNEYLDDFIKEVRDYNIRKGNRECEDTEVDILYQLNSLNRDKRSQYVQEIVEDEKPQEQEDRVTLSSKSIANEIKNLLFEQDQDEESVDDSMDTDENESFKVPVLEKTEEVIYSQESSDINDTNDLLVQEEDKEPTQEFHEESVLQAEEDTVELMNKDTRHKKLLEETQHLKVQMDEYEDELTDLSDGVEKTNKMLNFILAFLIFVLLVILGFIGYSIWKVGGFN